MSTLKWSLHRPSRGIARLRAISCLPFTTILATSLVVLALAAGWRIRNEYFISAEYGFGYALGVTGASMMLLLLLYPLRKRFFRHALAFISIKNWFKLHMALGVLGPLLILYHCNFSLGSINSNVALGSMLLMVTSGLIGRFIYTKIHHGLYGERIKLSELELQKSLTEQQLNTNFSSDVEAGSNDLQQRLEAFKQKISKSNTLSGNLFNILSLGISTRLTYRRAKHELWSSYQQTLLTTDQARGLPRNRHRQETQINVRQIADFLSSIRKIASLSFYEKLFSIWHMLHLPIFFMLIITGFVHVYAVHFY